MEREGKTVLAACAITLLALTALYTLSRSWPEALEKAFDGAMWAGLITFLVVNGNSIRGLVTGMQPDRAMLGQIEVNLQNLRMQQEQMQAHIRLMETQHAELQQRLALVQVVRPEVVLGKPRVTVKPPLFRVLEATPPEE